MRRVLQLEIPEPGRTSMPLGLPACLASLLEIPLQEVPDLIGHGGDDYWRRANLWLSGWGYQLLDHRVTHADVAGLHIRIGRVSQPVTWPVDYALIFEGKILRHDPTPAPEPRYYRCTDQRWLLLPKNPRR